MDLPKATTWKQVVRLVRCPTCDNIIMLLGMPPEGRDHWIDVCPECGVDFIVVEDGGIPND